MLTLPTQAHNGFGVINQLFAPAVPGGCAAFIAPDNTPGCTIPVNTMWRTNPTTHNFAPHAGFSWDSFKNGKTALRGGFGMFDILPLPYVYSIGNSLSVPFSKQLSGKGTYQANIDPASLGNSALARYIDQNPHRSYAMNYNLNIQREITSKISGMVGYVASHSVHEAFTADDSNQVGPTDVRLINGVWTWPLPVHSGPLLNGNVGDIRAIFFDGSAKYNSFQSQIQVKGLRGFMGQASFTLGKCFDDGSGAQLDDPFLTSLPSLIFFDKLERHGRCDFDVHKNLPINTLYDFGIPKTDSGLMKRVAGGWQLGMIMTASTGTPFTVVTASDDLGQNSTDPWSFPKPCRDAIPTRGTSEPREWCT